MLELTILDSFKNVCRLWKIVADAQIKDKQIVDLTATQMDSFWNKIAFGKLHRRQVRGIDFEILREDRYIIYEHEAFKSLRDFLSSEFKTRNWTFKNCVEFKLTCDVPIHRLEYHAMLAGMSNLKVLSLTQCELDYDEAYTDDEDDDDLFRGPSILDISFIATSTSLKKVWLKGWRLISMDDHCKPLLQLDSLAIVKCTMDSTLLRKLIRSSRDT